jgi:hypothetical protein
VLEFGRVVGTKVVRAVNPSFCAFDVVTDDHVARCAKRAEDERNEHACSILTGRAVDIYGVYSSSDVVERLGREGRRVRSPEGGG